MAFVAACARCYHGPAISGGGGAGSALDLGGAAIAGEFSGFGSILGQEEHALEQQASDWQETADAVFERSSSFGSAQFAPDFADVADGARLGLAHSDALIHSGADLTLSAGVAYDMYTNYVSEHHSLWKSVARTVVSQASTLGGAALAGAACIETGPVAVGCAIGGGGLGYEFGQNEINNRYLR